MPRQPRIDHPHPCPVEARGDPHCAVGHRADTKVHGGQAVQHDPGVERADRAAGVLEIRLRHLAHELARAADHAAKAAPAAIDVLRGGIDDDVGALLGRAGKDRGREHVVHDDQRARRVRDAGDTGDVHHLQHRVRHAFKEHDAGAGRDRRLPFGQVGAVHQRHIHPEAREDVENVKARSEQLPRRHHPVAGLDQRHHRAVDGRHAGRCGEGVLGPFQRRHSVLEHPARRVAVAGIDELIGAGLLEPALGLFGAVVSEALGQEQRLGHLAILAAAGAGVDGAGAGMKAV